MYKFKEKIKYQFRLVWLSKGLGVRKAGILGKNDLLGQNAYTHVPTSRQKFNFLHGSDFVKFIAKFDFADYNKTDKTINGSIKCLKFDSFFLRSTVVDSGLCKVYILGVTS